MPQIRQGSDVVTQITTFEVPRENQAELMQILTERARFMATQPGFVSVTIHRGLDDRHIVNYIQWRDREQLEAAHHSPEFRQKWPRLGELVKEVEPVLYEVAHVEEK
jgi:heme-degrading monooxygenase HmoA